MVFGEIVEPSTRALIDDELEEYPEYSEPALNWEGNNSVPPHINSLIFIETEKIKKLFKTFILGEENAICSFNDSVYIHQQPNDVFIVSFAEKDLTTGQIIKVLGDWITKADNIYAITSASIATYQSDLSDKPECLIRTLSSRSAPDFGYKKLESPNLVSGLGAQVLSYSIHTGLNCGLFVIYVDASPLDSLNTSPIVELMRSLKLPLKPRNVNLNAPASNLYL